MKISKPVEIKLAVLATLSYLETLAQVSEKHAEAFMEAAKYLPFDFDASSMLNRTCKEVRIDSKARAYAITLSENTRILAYRSESGSERFLSESLDQNGRAIKREDITDEIDGDFVTALPMLLAQQNHA